MRVTRNMKEHVESLHQIKGVKPTMETILWGVVHYLENSPQAMLELVESLGADQKPGDLTKQYFVLTPQGEAPIGHEHILFYTGVLVHGKPYPLSSVTAENAPEDQCGECGVMAPCSREIIEGVPICNHCRIYLTEGQGTLEVCQSCPKKSCSNHPYNANNIMKLPAPAHPYQASL